MNRHALAPLTLAALLALAAGAVQAGAVTDGSVGAVQTLNGAFVVPQTLGTVRGANLFHSFTRFGIAAGESALFTTTDAGLRFVIARVTGGEASLLQGPLALQAAAGSRPDFVLVNPSGVVVTQGARFDVPAGLHLSTAQQLGFADGSSWDTRSATPSSLTVAAPERFGFVGPGAALRWTDTPQTVSGGTLALSAGAVTIERSRIEVVDGGLKLQAQGPLTLGPGSDLNVGHTGSVAAADVDVRAGSLRIDGGGQASGLGGYALGSGTGPALRVQVDGAATLVDGGQLFTTTFGSGRAGDLTLRAASLTMDAGAAFTFIGTQSLGQATGATGDLQLAVGGAVQMTGASLLTVQAAAGGTAGRLMLDAASLRVDGLGQPSTSGLDSLGAGPVQVRVAGELALRDGGTIQSRNHAVHAPQPLQVQAGRIALDGGGTQVAAINTYTGQDTPSAPLQVSASESITLDRGGQINAASLGRGDTGAITVAAPRVAMTGSGERVTGILASAYGGERGRAGPILVQATDLQVAGDATIASEALADGGASGDITLQAARVVVDGRGGASSVRSVSYGADAVVGTVLIDATERVELLDGGAVFAGAVTSGSAGAIRVKAPTLLLDGRTNATYYTGLAGDVLSNQGAGASVQVDATRVDLRNGGSISTSTYTSADAGSVRVTADTLRVDGGGPNGSSGISASTSAAGRAGDVTLVAREIELTDLALVTTATLGSGAGGRIDIQAGRLSVDTSASIASVAGGSGAAGDVHAVVSGELAVTRGGTLSATTGGAGAAGRVALRAGSLRVEGVDDRNGRVALVSSRANADSGGQPGSVTLDVQDTLRVADGGSISIANFATVADPAARQPGTLALSAGRVELRGGEVTAASSGNVDAGSVHIDSRSAVQLVGAAVRTSAVDGNGGAIAISAADVVQLRDARVTTSVEGARNGNGGDITITAPVLVLQSGYVQANTLAPRSRGGDVRIDVAVLLPDGGAATLGGDRVVDFRPGVPGLNVVQAAAPDGVSGTLAVTVPQLDLSGSLAALFAVPVDFGPLGRDLCRVGDGSSLTPTGRGALPAPASAPLGYWPR